MTMSSIPLYSLTLLLWELQFASPSCSRVESPRKSDGTLSVEMKKTQYGFYRRLNLYTISSFIFFPQLYFMDLLRYIYL